MIGSRFSFSPKLCIVILAVVMKLWSSNVLTRFFFSFFATFQLVIFGGMNDQNDFNDVCILQTRAALKHLPPEMTGNLMKCTYKGSVRYEKISFIQSTNPTTAVFDCVVSLVLLYYALWLVSNAKFAPLSWPVRSKNQSSHAFCRTWRRDAFALSSDWFIALLKCVVIGQSDYLVLRQSQLKTAL